MHRQRNALLVLIMTISLVACGGNAPQHQPTGSEDRIDPVSNEMGAGGSFTDSDSETTGEADGSTVEETNEEEEIYRGFEDSDVVCRDCSEEKLGSYRRGIPNAMHAFVAYLDGFDVMPDYSPVTFHVSSDEFCGEYGEDASPFSARDQICLFDHEQDVDSDKENLLSHVITVHEALHTWFSGRAPTNYAFQEPFCVFVSFQVTGFGVYLEQEYGLTRQDDPCSFNINSNPNRALMNELCSLGATGDDIRYILQRIGAKADEKGDAITMEEVVEITSQILEQDARKAFASAGIL